MNLRILSSLVFLIMLFSVIQPYRGLAMSSAVENQSFSEADWKFWQPADVKGLDPWGDANGDANDLVAVYYKAANDLHYFRVDFLDLAADIRPHLYLALDFMPGGTASLGSGSLAADISWDLLLSLSGTGAGSAIDSTLTDHAGYISDLTVDSQLDFVEFSLTPAALTGWDGQPFQIQAIVTDGEAVVDKTAPVSTASKTGRGKLVLEFGNLFAGYGPHAVSWYDGYAFTPPDRPGERVGLKYLLDAIEKYEIPLTIHDLRVDVLAANDYLGIANRLRDLNGRGLLDLLPTLTYGYFMPWQPADVDAVAIRNMQQARQDFDMPQGEVFYPYEAMLTAADLAEIREAGYPAIYGLDRYGYWLGWINDWGNVAEVQSWYANMRKIHEINGVLVFFGLQGIGGDPRWTEGMTEPGWYPQNYASSVGTDGGLHHGWRRILLDMALDPDQEQYIAFGTDLTLTSWYLPGEAERSALWIASHPWIEATTFSDLLTRDWTPVDHGDLGLAPGQPLERFLPQNDGHYNAYFWQFYYGGISDGHSPFIPAGTTIEGYYDYVPYLRDGQPIPSGMKMGDDQTPGTIVYETLRNLRNSPDNDLTRLAWYAYFLNVAEQTFHAQTNWRGGENPGADLGGAFLHPGVKSEANRLRQVNKITAGAQWAEDAAQGKLPAQAQLMVQDLDLDGEDEYILKNDKVFAIFENDGGVLEYAFAYEPSIGPVQLVGPTSNLTIGGTRNYEDGEGFVPFPNVETAFEDGEEFRYSVYSVTLEGQTLTFASLDNRIRKTFSLEGDTIQASYRTVDLGQTNVSFAFPLDPSAMFARDWSERISQINLPGSIGWQTTAGGYLTVNFMDTTLGNASVFTDSPARTEMQEREGDVGYSAGHWLFFPYAVVTVGGSGDFDLSLTLAAKIPSTPGTPAPTESPGGEEPSGPQPVHCILFAGVLLLLITGVTIVLLKRKRKRR